jgi:hypothetical protein
MTDEEVAAKRAENVRIFKVIADEVRETATACDLSFLEAAAVQLIGSINTITRRMTPNPAYEELLVRQRALLERAEHLQDRAEPDAEDWHTP